MKVHFEENCVFINEVPIPPSGNDFINRRYPTKKKKEFLKLWNTELLKIGHQTRFKVWRFLFGDVRDRALFADRRAIATMRVEYIWLTPLTTKKGDRMKRMDSDNRIKLIQDCIADFIGVDDCYFKEFSWETYHCNEENFCFRTYKPVKFRA